MTEFVNYVSNSFMQSNGFIDLMDSVFRRRDGVVISNAIALLHMLPNCAPPCYAL